MWLSPEVRQDNRSLDWAIWCRANFKTKRPQNGTRAYLVAINIAIYRVRHFRVLNPTTHSLHHQSEGSLSKMSVRTQFPLIYRNEAEFIICITNNIWVFKLSYWVICLSASDSITISLVVMDIWDFCYFWKLFLFSENLHSFLYKHFGVLHLTEGRFKM